LKPGRQDVRRYVRDVEECLIRTLALRGLEAKRIGRWPGVWLGSEEAGDARKVGAIGVHISRWLTSHGFALNVNTDLSHFQLIIPCGIQEAGVTSMQRELGCAQSLSDVLADLGGAFGVVFDQPVQVHAERVRTVSVAVLREAASGPEVLLLRRTAERGGYWQLVTGRVEGRETPKEAAQRELEEETGAKVSVASLDYSHAFALGDSRPPRIAQEDAFVATWPSAVDVRLGPEHDAYEWVSAELAQERLSYAGLRQAVRRAKGRNHVRHGV
jgi:lipoyl(octanoyl) transferase